MLLVLLPYTLFLAFIVSQSVFKASKASLHVFDSDWMAWRQLSSMVNLLQEGRPWSFIDIVWVDDLVFLSFSM